MVMFFSDSVCSRSLSYHFHHLVSAKLESGTSVQYFGPGENKCEHLLSDVQGLEIPTPCVLSAFWP